MMMTKISHNTLWGNSGLLNVLLKNLGYADVGGDRRKETGMSVSKSEEDLPDGSVPNMP